MAALGMILRRKVIHWQKQVICVSCRRISEWEKYSKYEGVPLKAHRILQQDYDISLTGLIRYLNKRNKTEFEESERFIPERHKILGPDLATAHFIIERNGKVKFKGKDEWFGKDNQGNYFLPNRHVTGMYLEAIDCSNTWISFIGLDNFINLEHLRYINFTKCENVDDWFLSRLHLFRDTLEFLDLSGCKQVTERGLACLHVLKKLECLKLSGMTHIENMYLVLIMLQELLPNCTILGVDNPPSIHEKDSSTRNSMSDS